MVEADVGHHRHAGVHHVGGVPAAAESHLEDRHIDRPVGEPAQGGPGQDLEPGQPDARTEQRLEPGQVGEDLGQLGVADRLAVGGQPLVDALQVGAGEGTDPQALGRQQRGEAASRGRLAVGAGDVDGRGRPARDGRARRPGGASDPGSGGGRRVSASIRSRF